MMLKRIATILFCVSAGACSLFVDKNTHDYPQASKDAFMSSCMARSGGQQEACSCMLSKVQEQYTYGEMADIEQKMKDGQAPPEFGDFMNKAKDACMAPAGAPKPSKSVQR